MLIGLLGTASMSQEAGTWTQKADMPTARYLPGSAVVDGKIYTMGGKPGPARPDPVYSTVYEFDPGLPDSLSTVSPGGKLTTTWGKVKR